LEVIGIFIPGRNVPCLSLLSSTMRPILLEIPKKFFIKVNVHCNEEGSKLIPNNFLKLHLK